MARLSNSLICGLLFAASQLARSVAGLDLTVSTSGGNESSPILYGLMFEDINHSGDGGIHGQLLRNNGFQGPDTSLDAYAAIGNVKLSVDTQNPLSAAIPRSLKVDVPEGVSGQVGFSNAGYWGIPVTADTYTTSFYIKGDYVGPITVRLAGAASGTEYAAKTVNVVSTSTKYSQIETTFQSKQAPDGNNIWTLTFDASKVAGRSLNFDYVQLFPPTFNGRPNGLKPAIANVVSALKGSFLRFPGGNNLEGMTPETRWKWNETIGPLTDRPGRNGTWGYPNTDALGLNEYFLWCQDMNLKPILVVWDGLSLDGPIITGDALEPYIDNVLNELEYVLGDATTQYGALRASHGFPDPWPVTHVGIGNEDHLWGGGPSYAERFTRFHDAIKKAYPQLTIIASTPDYLPDPKPAGIWLDWHTYDTTDQMVGRFNMFDNVDRAFPYFVGEFACVSKNDGVHVPFPIMQTSVAEAVFMIGIERNSDVVKMAAYAPLLEHADGDQWTPNLIPFNNNPDGVVRTTSYYVQQLFSVNRGKTILPVKADGPFGPVYWVASRADNTFYVKFANYGNAPQKVTVHIDGPSRARLTTLSGGPDATNNFSDTQVTPQSTDIGGQGGAFAFELPAWSVAVLVAE